METGPRMVAEPGWGVAAHQGREVRPKLLNIYALINIYKSTNMAARAGQVQFSHCWGGLEAGTSVPLYRNIEGKPFFRSPVVSLPPPSGGGFFSSAAHCRRWYHAKSLADPSLVHRVIHRLPEFW